MPDSTNWIGRVLNPQMIDTLISNAVAIADADIQAITQITISPFLGGTTISAHDISTNSGSSEHRNYMMHNSDSHKRNITSVSVWFTDGNAAADWYSKPNTNNKPSENDTDDLSVDSLQNDYSAGRRYRSKTNVVATIKRLCKPAHNVYQSATCTIYSKPYRDKQQQK